MSIYDVRDLRAAWMAAGKRLDAALDAWSLALDINGTSDPGMIQDIQRARAEHEAAWDAYRAAR